MSSGNASSRITQDPATPEVSVSATTSAGDDVATSASSRPVPATRPSGSNASAAKGAPSPKALQRRTERKQRANTWLDLAGQVLNDWSAWIKVTAFIVICAVLLYGLLALLLRAAQDGAQHPLPMQSLITPVGAVGIAIGVVAAVLRRRGGGPRG
jgi:hypothetical protein